MSMPFHDKKFILTQPDGSQIEARGTGDQYSAIFKTPDGYTITRDPTSGFYHYAKLDGTLDALVSSGVRVGTQDPKKLGLEVGVLPSPAARRAGPTPAAGLARSPTRWQTRRAQRRAAMQPTALGMPAPPEQPTVGDFVGLCLLVHFKNEKPTISKEEVDNFCNKRGYKGFGNNGSVFDYFNDVSDGKLRYTNIIAPYYETKHPRAYYTNEEIDQPIRAEELIREALAYHLENGFDFSSLTADKGNYVNAVNVFYAGDCTNNWAKGLWPHSYHLSSGFKLANKKFAYDYQITNMGDELTLGTFCHENGHMICDFPDLYDYGHDSKGVGDFCLMCTGNRSEKNPVQVGAYLKHAAGWTSDVKQLVPGSEVKLAAGRNEFSVHRRAGTREYFIIENRNKARRDAHLPGSGLAIWHVDEKGSNNDQQMTPDAHYECSIIQADNLNQLEEGVGDGDEKDLFGNGNDAFGPGTKPNSAWWNNTNSGLSIQRITAAGPIISFYVAGDEV